MATLEPKPALSDREIESTFTVMKQLRTHLEEKDYLAKVKGMVEGGFRLATIEQDGRVTCVAGYRVSESLAWGRFMYVHDLVTAASVRSKGHGKLMLDWLVAEAKRGACVHFQLDSGTQRVAAHRFYLRERMDITAFHFGKAV